MIIPGNLLADPGDESTVSMPQAPGAMTTASRVNRTDRDDLFRWQLDERLQGEGLTIGALAT
jgi:hypothetical protein